MERGGIPGAGGQGAGGERGRGGPAVERGGGDDDLRRGGFDGRVPRPRRRRHAEAGRRLGDGRPDEPRWEPRRGRGGAAAPAVPRPRRRHDDGSRRRARLLPHERLHGMRVARDGEARRRERRLLHDVEREPHARLFDGHGASPVPEGRFLPCGPRTAGRRLDDGAHLRGHRHGADGRGGALHPRRGPLPQRRHRGRQRHEHRERRQRLRGDGGMDADARLDGHRRRWQRARRVGAEGRRGGQHQRHVRHRLRWRARRGLLLGRDVHGGQGPSRSGAARGTGRPSGRMRR